MDKKKIKRIIAREGLIILSIISLGLLLISTPYIFLGIENFINIIFRPSSGRLLGWVSEPLYIRIPRNIGILLLYLGYPFYLIIRFILWAIKTLKEE